MGLFSRRKSKDEPSQLAGLPPVPVDTRPAPAALPSLPPPQQPQPSPPQYHAPQISGIVGHDASHSTFRAAAHMPPPPAYPQQPGQQQPPVVVNQHYYMIQSTPLRHDHPVPSTSTYSLTKLVVGSAVNLTNQVMPGVLPALLDEGSVCASRMPGPAGLVTQQMYEWFNDLMTHIDRDKYAGNESDLFTYQHGSAPSAAAAPTAAEITRGQLVTKPKKTHPPKKEDGGHPKGQTTGVAAGLISGSYFAKVELYANSRLPMDLPPLKLYISTWPLVCLAARYSERVYEKPCGDERDVHVDSDFRTGTKAMVIKSVPMDDMSTIVFAIRGTASFADWTVNLNTDPISPVGFLDDYGNYCHAGFLSVARRMVAPVAARLRQLLQENPTRRSSSLLITGHSAGGAVATLLYAHMLSTGAHARSELNSLTASFKRVHCVTFGTPPVSLLPLQKPSSPELRKSLFFSFVNEGDPVARADKAYVRSLLELLTKPAPPAAAKAPADTASDKSRSSSVLALPDPGSGPKKSKSKSSLVSAKSGRSGKGGKVSKSHSRASSDDRSAPPPAAAAAATTTTTTITTTPALRRGPVWKVPPSTLSNAGRIVVLRSGESKTRPKGKRTVEERLNEGVVAQIATDEQLRTQIWGDPVCHLMKLYFGRVETLAVNAATAKGY